MAVYDFFLSRNGAPVTAETYVGHTGRLFYDDATGEIRISDGVTAGGSPIPITIATSATAGSVRPGAGFTISPGGLLSLNAGPMFELDGSDVFQLKPGTADRIGGIKAGSGVVIASDGTLAINLDEVEAFSFGDFSATVGTYTDSTEYALLSSVKEDEDVVIASNGNGSVCVVGTFHIHKTNGTVTGSLEDAEPFFQVKDDGQVRILVPLADTTEGGMEIIGSDLGTSLAPGIAGTMLHLTGNADIPTRVYHDTLGGYSSYVFRRYNGSVASPTQVLSGEDIGRINFTAATDAGMGNVATAQVSVTALENQTTTAQGSSITFTVTPVGATASNRVDVAKITSVGVLPGLDDAFDLGSTDFRWQSLYLGPGTIVIEDTVTGEDASITVSDGVLLIDGANQLQVGQLKFIDNTIESETPDVDIRIGELTDTADLLLNRNVVIGAGKTLTGSVTLAALSAGNYLTGTDYTGATARTFAVDATTTNTASKVVARDASGNFAAGTITADLIGDVTGNADTATTATNLAAATSILAGSLNINPTIVAGNTASTQTFTLTGLTTNHKVLITSQAALPYEIAITAAWASAANTLSIQFQNYDKGDVDPAAFDIAYFAWV